MRSSTKVAAFIVLSLLAVQPPAAARQNFSESMRAAALEFGKAQRYLPTDIPDLAKAMETMARTPKPEALARCTAPLRLLVGQRPAAAALLVNPVCGECDRVVDLVKKFREESPQEAPTVYIGEVPSSEEASIEAVVLLKQLASDPDARLALLQELLSRQPSTVEAVREIAKAYAPDVVARRERHELSDEAPCDKEILTPVVIYRERVLQKTRVGRIAFDPLRNMESLRLALKAVDDLQAPATEPVAGREHDERGICRNPTVARAFRIMASVCTPQFCDPHSLRALDELDRDELLKGFRSPYLMPVHLFFKQREHKLTQALDWQAVKRDQLRTLAYLNDPDSATIFIVGSTSKAGDQATNMNLSRDRMYATYDYLKNVLKVKCKSIQGVFLPGGVLRLRRQDAMRLKIVPRDYRQSEKILNQSVHVYVYPCADRL